MAQAFALRPPSIARPANIARSLFHIGSGIGTLLLIELVLSERGMIIVATSVAGWAWSMEITRRFSERWNRILMRFFRMVAHPHEAKAVNSSTWYMTALVVLALTQSKLAASIGVVVLAVGDPFAGWFGRAFGRIKLVGRRSLEGSLAFVLSAAPAAFLVVYLFHPEIDRSSAVAYALVGSMVGAVAELFASRFDDNFVIPVAAGGAAFLLTLPLG